jgi:hypothetical protein
MGRGIYLQDYSACALGFSPHSNDSMLNPMLFSALVMFPNLEIIVLDLFIVVVSSIIIKEVVSACFLLLIFL